MMPQVRPFGGEEDYWRIRAFLREVFRLNDRHELSWQVARLDYWRWHGIPNCGYATLDGISIWETPDGRIAAVLTPEGKGHAHLQVHPAFRSVDLEEEMIETAERTLATPVADPSHATEPPARRLRVWAHAHDGLRRGLLLRRGYERKGWADDQRRRSLQAPPPEPPPVPGYVIRSLGGPEELPSRSWASWRAFHPDEPDERYQGWEWYLNLQNGPLYRGDLDMVAVTETGEVAAFCTLWYDDVTRTGYFEPVGRKPEHARRGLMRALLFETMRRARERGADLVTVAGTSLAGNTLYASVMGLSCQRYEQWIWET